MRTLQVPGVRLRFGVAAGLWPCRLAVLLVLVLVFEVTMWSCALIGARAARWLSPAAGLL